MLQLVNFLFFYLLHTAPNSPRVFEAEASARERMCLYAKKRKRKRVRERKRNLSKIRHSRDPGFAGWQKCNNASPFLQQQHQQPPIAKPPTKETQELKVKRNLPLSTLNNKE
jgi:hypothetical protein